MKKWFLSERLRETGLILRCDRKVGNPFQTKQGSRPSCPDQEGRKGSEEGVPENLGVLGRIKGATALNLLKWLSICFINLPQLKKIHLAF